MKSLSYFLGAGIALWLCAGGTALAQDPIVVAPHAYKVLLENDQVRVCRASVKPADTIAMHSHPNHIIYVTRSGKVLFTFPDGKSQEVEMKAGEVIWGNAESHAARNIGNTEVRVIVVELKEPSKKPEEPKTE